MTLESMLLVAVGRQHELLVRTLAERASITARRAGKLLPGEGVEASRLNELTAAISACALASVWAGEPSIEVPASDWPDEGPLCIFPGASETAAIPLAVEGWLDSGRVVAALRLPHSRGETPILGMPGAGPPPPAQRWRSRSERTDRAMTERFRALLERALAEPDAPDAAIRPSRIANSVLTETLREFAGVEEGASPREVPVSWSDGSAGPVFPLRCLDFAPDPPEGWRVLRFTLLSIRHVEMDADVDGAWLRNARISRPRPAGETDRLVYETSLRQLAAVADGGPTLLYIYQTGLEPAVVGFYRAVARQLLSSPGSIAVVPCYFRGRGRFREGALWATR